MKVPAIEKKAGNMHNIVRYLGNNMICQSSACPLFHENFHTLKHGNAPGDRGYMNPLVHDLELKRRNH